MPYPLEQLQYGLRRRLRELATRSEAYDLQIAAPNYIGFQPIQKTQTVPDVRFTIDKKNNLKKFINWGEGLADNDELLYIASFNFIFDYCTPNNNLNVIFDNFRLSPNHLHFYDCLMDTSFIEKFLMALNDWIVHIELFPCSFTSDDAIRMICKAPAFEALESIYIIEPPVVSSVWTWIEAFVEAGCTSLNTFKVLRVPQSVFEIDKDVFFKFFKAQRDNFNIEFDISDETVHASTTDLLKNLFEEHFKRLESEEFSNQKLVKIRFKKNLVWGYTLRDE